MTKISDLTSLAGAAADPAADLFPIVDMSEAGTARNKKITPDEVKVALDLDTSASPQFTALNLGHASDTTLTRVSAGVVAIEGVNIVTTAGGVTFAADIVVPDEAYDATAWNGSLEAPTKNAVRDKIESLSVGGGIDVEDEGVSEATGVTILNFVGAGVAATDAGGGQVDVTISGGGGGVDVEDEGVSEATGATTLNFVGAGVTAADQGGGVVDVTIPGGGTFSGVLMHKSADETTANYLANRPIPFDSETSGYDTDSYHPLAATVTITIATPGVITWTGHNFLAASPIVLTTTGALPTGLTAGTTYYVVNPAANTFQLSATPGGAAINTTGSQSGTHTGTNYSRITIPSNGKYQFKGHIEIGTATLTASEYARSFIMKNGSVNWIGRGAVIVEVSDAPGILLDPQSQVVDCVTGDYFELSLDTEADNSITIAAAVSSFGCRRIS